MWHRVFDFLSSLKLTLVCLSLALVLVFLGTMAQVHLSTHEAQLRYFQSLFVWWPLGGWGIPVFPGGHLLGGVLLLNLLAAQVRRFRWAWSQIGIQLTHAGLVVLLGGIFFTDLLSVESYMRLAPGETKNYSEDARAMEIVLVEGADETSDRVVAIPEARLLRGGPIAVEGLPFQIAVRRFYPNSRLQEIGNEDVAVLPAATEGIGPQVSVREVPKATAENDRNLPSAILELLPPAGPPLGTWLVSSQLAAPQSISYAGKSWQVAMRPARYYKPFSLTLRKFTHERYVGTQIPKRFASQAVLTDPERNEHRDVLLSMNHPLRYRGETFFQAGFEEDDAGTILQVVYNPSDITPYIACVLVSLGLLVQFSYHFLVFLRRQKRGQVL
jgi:hypothetical protein